MIRIRHIAAASFIIGMLIGAAILNLVSGTYIDTAELEIQKLNTKLADQAEQITALEKTLEQRQKSAVTEIEVHVNFKNEKEGDEFNQIEIENIVKKLLKNIRGKEVSSLDPLLIANIIDDRTVEVSKRKFLLSVNCLLVSKKIVMYVDITEKAPTETLG